MSISIVLPRRRIVAGLVVIAVTLAVVGIGFTAYEWSLGVNNTYWALQASELFSLNHEGNIPTWFASTLLFSAAVLGVIIAHTQAVRQEKWVWHWRAFAVLFTYLTLDEASAIHEIFTSPLREALNTGGYLHFAWLIVGVPFVVLMGILFIPFVLRLPHHTRNSMIVAAFVYLSGAVVVEAISANQYYLNDGTSLLFSAIGTVEELLEMLGVIILLNGLLAYSGRVVGAVTLSIGERQSE